MPGISLHDTRNMLNTLLLVALNMYSTTTPTKSPTHHVPIDYDSSPNKCCAWKYLRFPATILLVAAVARGANKYEAPRHDFLRKSLGCESDLQLHRRATLLFLWRPQQRIARNKHRNMCCRTASRELHLVSFLYFSASGFKLTPDVT